MRSLALFKRYSLIMQPKDAYEYKKAIRKILCCKYDS